MKDELSFFDHLFLYHLYVSCNISKCLKFSSSKVFLFFYLQNFTGNNDTNGVQHHDVPLPVITSTVMIRPLEWNNNVGLRMELYGCEPGKSYGSDGPMGRAKRSETPFPSPSNLYWLVDKATRKSYRLLQLQAQAGHRGVQFW